MSNAERLAQELEQYVDDDSKAAAALLRAQAAEIEALKALLRDPVAVHVAMLRGEIARPPLRDFLHVGGEKELADYDAMRADAEHLRLSLTFIVDRDLTYFDGYVDRHQISMGAIEQARRVLRHDAAIDAARAAK